MTSHRTILVNTAALYARAGVATVLGLLGSRHVLAAFGVVDSGLFSVVAGITGFTASLNGAMAISSQRNLTHALGHGDLNRLRRKFATCYQLHVALAALLVILGETQFGDREVDDIDEAVSPG